MSDKETREMRALVLELAAVHANKAMAVVRDTDLDFGRVHENVDVGGVTWHICARYWEDDDVVKIDAQPMGSREGVPALIAHLFGAEMAAAEGGVEFSLPAAWVPNLGDER